MNEAQRQRPLQKYVRFLLSPRAVHAELKFDFPRPQGTAMIWHAQYMGMDPSPPAFKITNLTLLLVTYRNCGTQTLTHTNMQTSSSSLYSTMTISGIGEGDLLPVRRSKIRTWLVEE
jgi:hypothetical protein